MQKTLWWLAISACGVLVVWLVFFRSSHRFILSIDNRDLTIDDDGITVSLHNVSARTVADVIAYYDPSITDADRVFPSRDKKIFDDDMITIDRQHTVTVTVDGQEREIDTFHDRLASALVRGGVTLDKNDIVRPSRDALVHDDMDATIIRVIIKEEKETKKIAYKTEEKDDDTLNFLKRYTDQKGANGTKEITYEVAYHDGEEVAREIKSEEIVKEPVTEIIVQGTKVVVGKKHTGACSWYAHTGTLSAANPWLPIGSYVRVTNQANGKSVIVRINDRGPFVAGRIIDLDKVAFEKIASLGSGVIDVKMEEIIND